jgi:stress response protein SCP2
LRQPFLRIRDPDQNGRLLCQYNLSHHTKEHLAAHRSVIMCKIDRQHRGGWEVQGIGQLGQGAAGEYGPIKDACVRIIKS